MEQNELLDGSLVTVVMADTNWRTVVEGMEYLASFIATPLDATSEEMAMIAESIQDVLWAS